MVPKAQRPPPTHPGHHPPSAQPLALGVLGLLSVGKKMRTNWVSSRLAPPPREGAAKGTREQRGTEAEVLRDE